VKTSEREEKIRGLLLDDIESADNVEKRAEAVRSYVLFMEIRRRQKKEGKEN